jgi:hypothetical protein
MWNNSWTIIAAVYLSACAAGFISFYSGTSGRRFASSFGRLPAVPSLPVATIFRMALQADNHTDTIRHFYDMKYNDLSYTIKGLGAAILAFLSPFLEKTVKDGKAVNHTDLALLACVGLLLILLMVLILDLKRIVKEYSESITLYYLLK